MKKEVEKKPPTEDGDGVSLLASVCDCVCVCVLGVLQMWAD